MFDEIPMWFLNVVTQSTWNNAQAKINKTILTNKIKKTKCKILSNYAQCITQILVNAEIIRLYTNVKNSPNIPISIRKSCLLRIDYMEVVNNPHRFLAWHTRFQTQKTAPFSSKKITLVFSLPFSIWHNHTIYL